MLEIKEIDKQKYFENVYLSIFPLLFSLSCAIVHGRVANKSRFNASCCFEFMNPSGIILNKINWIILQWLIDVRLKGNLLGNLFYVLIVD